MDGSVSNPRSAAARKARGLHRLEVWLPEPVIRLLDEVCEREGDSRPETI